eukprot:1115850-Rhodomonas_salina.2
MSASAVARGEGWCEPSIHAWMTVSTLSLSTRTATGSSFGTSCIPCPSPAASGRNEVTCSSAPSTDPFQSVTAPPCLSTKPAPSAVPPALPSVANKETDPSYNPSLPASLPSQYDRALPPMAIGYRQCRKAVSIHFPSPLSAAESYSGRKDQSPDGTLAATKPIAALPKIARFSLVMFRRDVEATRPPPPFRRESIHRAASIGGIASSKSQNLPRPRTAISPLSCTQTREGNDPNSGSPKLVSSPIVTVR